MGPCCPLQAAARAVQRDAVLRGVQQDLREDVVLWPSTSERLPAMLHFLADDPRFEQNEEKYEKSVPFFGSLAILK